MATNPAQFDFSDRPDVKRRFDKAQRDKTTGRQMAQTLRDSGAFGKGFMHQQQMRNALLGQMSGGVQQPVNEASRSNASVLSQYGPPTPEQHRSNILSDMQHGPPQAPQSSQRAPRVDPALAQRFQLLSQARAEGVAPQALLERRQQNRATNLGNERLSIENSNLREQVPLARETLASREKVEGIKAGAQTAMAETDAEARKFVARESAAATLGVSNNTLKAALAGARSQERINKLVQAGNTERAQMALEVQKAGQELQLKAQAMGVLPQDIAAISQPLAAAIQVGDADAISRLMPAMQQLIQISAASSAQNAGILGPPQGSGAQPSNGQPVGILPPPQAPSKPFEQPGVGRLIDLAADTMQQNPITDTILRNILRNAR